MSPRTSVRRRRFWILAACAGVVLALCTAPSATAAPKPDCVTQVNDTPIDSMATLIGLWPRLQGASTVSAVVLRNGQPVTLTVSLR